MRLRCWVLAALVAGSLAACAPELTNGAYTCVSNETCPEGWRCLDGRCYSAATGDCTTPEDCDDGKPCTLDTCDGGSCRYEVTPGVECDNGVFCDGTDTCDAAGTCVASGMPPCPGCDASGPGTGCMGCGQIGQPCCMGICGEGSCDDTDHCVDCGCASDTCLSGFPCDPDHVCLSGACQDCGGQDEPCCNGTPRCTDRLTCTLGTCALPDAPCGGMSEPCCGSSPRCDMGLGCTDPVMGRCEPCGGMDQPCCEGSDTVCASGLACCTSSFSVCATGMLDTCQPCGMPMLICCASGLPCSIGSCIDGLCQNL